MSGAVNSHFPDKDVLARVLYTEGIRHLEDSRVLHKSERYPGAIASAMKAAEMGIKTIVVLDGAMGWWDKTFVTHSPLTDIKALAIFRHHVATLEEYRSTLLREVVEMESLAPTKPGAKAFDIELEKNPEYPFLSYKVDSVTGSGEFRLDAPSSYFLGPDSQRYFNTAQDLLNAVTTKYPKVRLWNLDLPERV